MSMPWQAFINFTGGISGSPAPLVEPPAPITPADEGASAQKMPPSPPEE